MAAWLLPEGSRFLSARALLEEAAMLVCKEVKSRIIFSLASGLSAWTV